MVGKIMMMSGGAMMIGLMLGAITRVLIWLILLAIVLGLIGISVLASRHVKTQR